jgi:DNA-binding FadR family transcriptional regulator
VAVTDKAVDKIKEMITSGDLRPGDRLPPEAELSALLGLSRSSLREAVRALSLIKVLDVRQGDGTFVTSLAPGLLLDAMSFAVDLQRGATVLQFLQVRRILEPVATAMATRRMSDEEVAGLGELLDELGEEPSVEELVANDQEFHHRIAAGSGNDVLASLIDGLSGPTHRVRVWRGLTEDAAVTRTLQEHRAIHRAMSLRQPDLAQAWANVHIGGVEQWLSTALDGQDVDVPDAAASAPDA